MLCGRCDNDYSLQLGGDRCIQCHDNRYVALLIVFAILGILLVAMITLFNLTVANGTINGLIFYANVVWINNAILFPQQGKNIGYYIITVPIAWINLDFGIETCFSQNLDQLTKSGLQFVFPVYILCIAGLIILVSWYSIKATRFFGRNSVAVLSTLILYYLMGSCPGLSQMCLLHLTFLVLMVLFAEFGLWMEMLNME